MSKSQQVWTVLLVPRHKQAGGHRLGIFTSEDEAIASAREKQNDPTYDSESWDIRIEGPRGPTARRQLDERRDANS